MTIEGAIAELQNLINADDVPFYYDGVIKKVIETIIDECKPKVREWIPCEERMPKAFENPVLVSGYKGYVSLGWWNGKEFETATRLPHIDVKAWQPLPEPYEMERSE